MTWKGHGRITMLMIVPAGAVVTAVTTDWRLAMAAALGVLAGLFVDPDLDITTPTGSRWRASAISPELGWLWRWFWWPYGWAIPHRSIWSHLPVLGTVLRVGYLLAPFCVMLWAVGRGDAVHVLLSSWLFWAWCGGLALSDAGHWLADGCPVRW